MSVYKRNSFAFGFGLVLGSLVNMGLIAVSSYIIPPPAGVDTSTFEGLKAAMPLFETKHFIFPFLAHAVGTFAGALAAAFIAVSHKMTFAMAIGVLFLIGGISAVMMLPAPMWFNVLDLVAAYIPTAWIAGKLATRE